MGIIKSDASNLKQFTELSIKLFPNNNFDEEYHEYEKCFKENNQMGFLFQESNQYVGMMHLSIRNDYVNGTDTSPVVYVEAIYVLPDYRKMGIGKAFIDYAEAFAKEKGIAQLASDCLIDNHSSEAFHKSCGFREEERVICFVKDVMH